MWKTLAGLALATLLVPAVVLAEIVLPPGFSAQLYVSGSGFDVGASQAGPGLPSSTAMAVDARGVLYMSRSGRRYFAAEVDDVIPVYRVPAGGGRLTPETERRYLYGPPLPNPQIAAIRNGTELFVTTFDRERRVGVLYRLADGRAALVAGGTPERGGTPVLTQPEGAAADRAGNLYVADREQGVIVKLDASGGMIDPRWVRITRPRILAFDDAGTLWVGADGAAEAPWQRGPGEIWRVTPDGAATMVLHGPVPAGMAVSPGGHVFLADRHAGKLLHLAPGGTTAQLATFTDGDAPRALAFVPDTPETLRAGIAGNLLVVTIRRGAFRLNEVWRIAGPFDAFARQHAR